MKYTQVQAEQILLERELILQDVYKDSKTLMFCVDFDGYKYDVRLNDVLSNKRPAPIHSNNQYVLHNIDLFLRKNNITAKRLSQTYVNSKTNMLWECECKQTFEATWNSITKGKHYCNFCAKSKRFNGLKDYTTIIKEECDRRGYILLTDYIHRSNSKFEYICKKHIEFGVKTSTYDAMVKTGRGCKQCGIESRTNKHKLPESVLKDLAESKGFIYVGFDYDNDDGKSNKVNIQIICPKHINKGVQRVKYDNLKKSTGKCIYCLGQGRTQEDVQLELDKMHGLIDILKYDKYMSPITAQCRICGHIWDTNGPSLINGHKCPKCVRSMFEIETSKLLDDWKYNYECQYSFDDCRDINPLPFDFYLYDYNILIEVDGEGHYKPIPRGSMSNEEAELQLQIVQKHDGIKTKYCIDNNIPLIRIPYWERKNLKSFLFNALNNYINNIAM